MEFLPHDFDFLYGTSSKKKGLNSHKNIQFIIQDFQIVLIIFSVVLFCECVCVRRHHNITISQDLSFFL